MVSNDVELSNGASVTKLLTTRVNYNINTTIHLGAGRESLFGSLLHRAGNRSMHRAKTSRWRRPLIALVLSAGVLAPFSARAQAPGPPSTAIENTPLFANDRVSAIKLSFPPGARESLHAHPFDIVVIQLTPGEVELVLDGKESSGAIMPGVVTYIPAQMVHSAGNVGSTPFDMVVLALR